MSEHTERASARADAILPPDHFFAGLKRNGYGVIVSDPPWAFRTRTPAGQGRSPSQHYRTRTIEEIMTDPVADLAARDAFLWLWCTGPHIVQGTHRLILDAWGFKPSSMGLVWIKTNGSDALRRAETWEQVLHLGNGLTTRQNAEFCILGRRGSPRRVARDVQQVIVSPVKRHSEKPKEALHRIERYTGMKGVELYSRTNVPGWQAWGDEAGKFDDAA